MSSSHYRCVFWLVLLSAGVSEAQWTHRYPQVAGYRHHVYLEGFELPVMGAGPTDPAPSPDGKSLAFAARGWLWLLDLENGEARRLTSGRAIDARPAFSADGSRLAFIRDDTEDTDIWSYDLATGEETALVETPAIELDPAYSADDSFLYYSSAENGDLDIWRLQLATGEAMPVTSARGIEVRPLPHPDGERLVYVAKGPRSPDRILDRNLELETERTLMSQSITSQTHPGLSPDGKALVVNWPGPDFYELSLIDPVNLDPIRLNRGPGLPLSPVFSADGRFVWYVEANEALQFELFRIAVTGGEPEHVPIRTWDWGVRTARVQIRSRLGENEKPVPARLHILDEAGHPVVSDRGMPRFDSSSGKVYVFSPGVASYEVPAGEVRVLATHGFTAPAVSASVTLTPGDHETLDLRFEPLWNPREKGWYAGDHHYHMNYGGPYRLQPEDLLLALEAEDLDVGTPLMANLQHRFNDLEFFDWKRLSERPFLAFGQEVRSHFLGHLGLVNITSPFWPWYWGPGYPIYSEDDRPNDEALRHARAQGGMTSYMHPVSVPDPFTDETTLRSIPLNLIPDAVLGELDALEVACLWTSELGTAEVWYRFLNIGVPIAASAGTDSFADYYRSMAVGSTRVYVKLDGPFNLESYLDGLKAGRSFLSTGPLLEFQVEGREAGEVLPRDQKVAWELQLSSPTAVEDVEILVNGKIAWSGAGLESSGRKSFEGTLSLPDGGWIAARAHGGPNLWPAMNGYPFAHTSPIWISERGSTDSAVARESARDLLRALNVADERLAEGYGAALIPELESRFAAVRSQLETIAQADVP